MSANSDRWGGQGRRGRGPRVKRPQVRSDHLEGAGGGAGSEWEKRSWEEGLRGPRGPPEPAGSL